MCCTTPTCTFVFSRGQEPATQSPRVLMLTAKAQRYSWLTTASQQGNAYCSAGSGTYFLPSFAASFVICCRIAIAMIQAYKDLVSPLLPSVCRFQPSCSTYSIEAFQQFGPSQGLTLMAWRILRCNPFRGGYQGQYDPPCWPPVGLEMWFKQ